MLELKPEQECRWDCVSLGEVMLRLDPGDQRISTTRTFRVWEGGGEYNVARGLRRTFGMRTAIATALADNAVGRLIEDLVFQGGVEQTLVRWVASDDIGFRVRNGLNFTERGFGDRPPLGCSDRGHSAASQLKPGDIDWERIFGIEGVRWFHTGGVFAGLSESTALVAEEAMAAARRHGTVVSYDGNYRASLWRDRGGREAAIATNRRLVSKTDVLIDPLSGLANGPAIFPEVARKAMSEFPNLRIVAGTHRTVLPGGRQNLTAMALAGESVIETGPREELAVYDRVGCGDAFAAGLIFGMFGGRPLEWSLECGLVNAVLTMTTPGDSGTATLREVESAMFTRGTDISR